MYYVYVLKSQQRDWLYIGYTTNLEKRFEEHQKGRSAATKPYRPFELVFYEAYKAMADAKHREKYFKTNQEKRAMKLMLQNSLR